MRSVEYTDEGGLPLKTYRLEEEVSVGDRHLPARVRLEHFAEGFVTTIHYEHWTPKIAPPPSLFSSNIEAGRFIERLKAYARETGLGGRLESDLAKSDEELRKFEERLLGMQGGEAAARGLSHEDSGVSDDE